MTQDPPSEIRTPARIDIIGFLARFAPLIFLIVLMTGFALYEPRFLTPLNLFNVLRQVSIYGLLAVGMTFVILTAGIDETSIEIMTEALIRMKAILTQDSHASRRGTDPIEADAREAV